MKGRVSLIEGRGPETAASGCRFRDVYPVAATLLMSFGMLYALVSPNPRTILWFVDSAWAVMMMEAVMLVPLAVASGNLHGRHRLANRIGIGSGVFAAAVCLLFGGAWFSLVVGLHFQGRIASLADEPDLIKYSTGDWKELVGLVKNRWMMQFAFFVAAMLCGNAAWDVRNWLAPETRGLLRAAGGTAHSLVDVISLLLSCSVYFFLSVLNDFFRLPCLFRLREAEPVPVRAIIARVEWEHRERAAAAEQVAAAAEIARAESDRSGAAITAALETPEGAQALLLALAGSGADPCIAGLPLSRRLIVADAALALLRLQSAAAQAATLERMTAVVAADARMTPVEFAFLVLARSRLGRNASPGARITTLVERAADCKALLALVARAGDGDVAKSMKSGLAALGLPGGQDPALPDSRGVSEALDRLQGLDARMRTRLVHALADAVFPMNEARVALLYAIAVALEAPLPAQVRVG